MKKIFFAIIITLLSTSPIVAQGMFDYYGLTTPSFNGNARYMGMGGSFGALGGNASAIADNPAALGIFRSNEFNLTLNIKPSITSSNWDNYNTKRSEFDVFLNNLTWVINFPSYNESGYLGSNISFSYNRLKKLDRVGELRNFNSPYSLTSLIADMTNGLTESDLKYVQGDYDPYKNPDIGYLSVLGYDGWLIDPITPGGNQWQSAFNSEITSYYQFAQNGYIDEYNFNYSGNINDKFYFGLGFSLQNYLLNTESHYSEYFAEGHNFNFHNNVRTDGSGFNFDLGIITRLSDAVRLGASFSSPTWYRFNKIQQTKLHSSKLVSYTEPPVFEWNYKYRSPMRVQLSAGFIIQQKAAINIDYIFMANKTQKVSSYYDNLVYKEFAIESQNMDKYELNTHTVRIGAETKVSQGTKVRLGFGYITAPMDSQAQKDFAINTTLTSMEYMVDKAQYYGSCGIGFQNKSFFFDIAYVYHHQPQKFVPFHSSDLGFGGSITNHQHNIVATLLIKY